MDAVCRDLKRNGLMRDNNKTTKHGASSDTFKDVDNVPCILRLNVPVHTAL